MAKETKGLTPEDVKEIAEIRSRIKEHQRVKNKAEAQIKACYEELKYYQGQCNHAYGYKTSCMGDVGFSCPDCGYGY